MARPKFLQRDPLAPLVVKLATTNQFDFRSPRIDDPVWRLALQMAVDKVERDGGLEVSRTNMSSAMAHAMMLLVQSIMNPKAVADNFSGKQKVLFSLIDSSTQAAHASVLGRKLEVGKPGKEKTAGDLAAEKWEEAFGKRGNQKVEADIAYTTSILQDKWEKAMKRRAEKGKREPKTFQKKPRKV